jgi:hypothetical protein
VYGYSPKKTTEKIGLATPSDPFTFINKEYAILNERLNHDHHAPNQLERYQRSISIGLAA